MCLCSSVELGLCAGIAQLVERKLPKLEVASSSLVARSIRVRPDDFPDSFKVCFITFRDLLYFFARAGLRKWAMPAFFYACLQSWSDE
jgi:hypothetical protein